LQRRSSLDPLRDFFRAARGCSQERIIIEFLEAVIGAEDLIDSGSVLITDQHNERLVLFNEEEVLFRKRILDPLKKAQWPSEFSFYGSAAGKSLRTRSPVDYVRGQGGDNEFFGQSPIENMVCIPIDMGGERPFGVVCFHNNVPGKKITPEFKDVLEAYADALAVALHTPHPELQIEKNIFIVHGRDRESRQELENILYRHGATPKVLADEDKNAQSILVALEDLIRTCKAGFILMTPDDEGRLRGEDTRLHRARENVIFETGLLFARFREFERVCLLLKEPTKLPSDLAGITYESFQSVRDIEAQVVTKLHKWKIGKRA
jgi:predicted nucleotide-binding protein